MPVRSQTFDSSGPDVRIRGNAYQVLEKYLALARDASAAGDRIAAENFYQHAEHYFRLINANNEHRQQQQQQQYQGQGQGQPPHQHHGQHGQGGYDQRGPGEGAHANGMIPGTGPQPGYGPQPHGPGPGQGPTVSGNGASSVGPSD